MKNTIDFFDFQFIIDEDGILKETRFNNLLISKELGNSLFFVHEKYMKKVKQHKFDKKKIETHKEEKEKMLNAWRVQKEHYQGHIRYQEKALGEKNRLLKAIGLIAHNVEVLQQGNK